MEPDAKEQFGEQIERAERLERLRDLRDRLHDTLGDDLLHADPLRWNEELNELHDRLIRQTVRLAERALRDEGMGAPPAPYAFVVFGSGGRGEQTLWSDQDNGLIYGDAEAVGEATAAETYFRALADCISRGLEILGYPPCTGNVLATNGRWRKPLGGWKRMIDSWFDAPDWENVRYLLIQADLRCVAGDARLAGELKRYYLRRVAEAPSILEGMLKNTLHRKVSLGPFGQLIRERFGEHAGGVDVKYGAYIPFINGIRLLAIRYGIACASTAGRIGELARQGRAEAERTDEWLRALALLIKLRALTPVKKSGNTYSSEGKLPAEMLTPRVVEELKTCLRAGGALQKEVKRTIGRALKYSALQKRRGAQTSRAEER